MSIQRKNKLLKSLMTFNKKMSAMQKKGTKIQLLNDFNTITNTTNSINESLNTVSRDMSNSFEMKEKLSSNMSLKLMAVASGDNVALSSVMNSGHKLKEAPSLVPCCEGKELQINEDLVRSGLSAISVKHEGLMQCFSVSNACDRLQIPPGLIKHRNSFRCLHRPDLKRVPYLRRMAPDELETLFRGYADTPKRCLGNNVDTRVLPPTESSKTKDMRRNEKGNSSLEDDENAALNPIPETRSCVDDIPAGMRLHTARGRLYTSVLAGARAGDQQDDYVSNEELDYHKIPPAEEPDLDEEVQLNEELQIILPPRYDEIAPGPSVTTTFTMESCCFN